MMRELLAAGILAAAMPLAAGHAAATVTLSASPEAATEPATVSADDAAVQTQERRRRGGRPGRDAEPPASGGGSDPAPADSGDEADDAEEVPTRDDRHLAITGGTVHTVSGGVRHGVTILTRNGRIIEMGPRVRIPEGAEIVDATGLHVYPGLVAVQSGGLVGGGNPADSTNPFSFSMTLGLAGGITSAVTGDAVAKLSFGTLEDHLLGTNLWQSISYDTRNPRGRARLRDALDEGRRHLAEKRAWELEKRTNPEAKEPTAPRGQAGQLLPLLTGESQALIGADGAHEILQACELAEEYGIRVIILGGVEAWTVAERLGRAGVSVILRPRQTREPDKNLVRENGSTIQNAAILHAHGVPVAVTPAGSLFGGGSGISLGGLAGRDNLHLPMAAAFAVRGGLSNAAAVRAITLDAARILGVDDRVGSIDVGKDADLIITDGDLLSYQTGVRWTIVNGRIAYDKEKDTLFSHIRPASPPEKDPADDYWPRRLGDGP